MITSLQNERVKLAYALQNQSKARRKEGKIVLEGGRLLRDACQQGHIPDFVLYSAKADGALLRSLPTSNLLLVSDAVMRHISSAEEPPGIVGVLPLPAARLPEKPARSLILDAVRDPGNVGTLLRTAAAAGVQAVLLAPTCADPYNPKALRGGMGAHFRLPLAALDWPQIAAYCAHAQVYLADSAGTLPYYQADWRRDWALLIGSEAHGAGDEAQRLAQTHISIPMAAQSESLNAAAAAAVILFHAGLRR
ncbi:MAG: RNA methyltransferase [Chloroflexi bacterium]|nr:RNA methyltransferase [Chloroflexota bacterium]